MNRNVHVPVAAVSALADLACSDRSDLLTAAEIVGRLVGGVLGGSLPDVIDPPTHPGHRGIGHGAIPAITALVLILRMMPNVQAALRRRAHELRRIADTRPSAERWPLHLEAITTEFLLGLVVGTPAGYASHLALVATTPAGLPWLVRGL